MVEHQYANIPLSWFGKNVFKIRVKKIETFLLDLVVHKFATRIFA